MLACAFCFLFMYLLVTERLTPALLEFHAVPLVVTISRMVMPTYMAFMAWFYIIWEVALNVLGELTDFPDRRFYGPFWDCHSFINFFRRWNTTVYDFLFRYVHERCLRAGYSKANAVLSTFVLSVVFHEWWLIATSGRLIFAVSILQLMAIPAGLVVKHCTLFRGFIGNVVFLTQYMLGLTLLLICYGAPLKPAC